MMKYDDERPRVQGGQATMSDPEKSSARLSSFRKTMRKLSEQLPGSETTYNRKLSRYEEEIESLQAQVKTLEEEVYHLQRRLDQTPKEFEFLRSKLDQSREQLGQAHNQNQRMVEALQQAKEQIESLREEVEKLSAPPSPYGIFASLNPDKTANIYTGGRKMKVNVHPSVRPESLRKGQELVLNEAFNVIEAAGFDEQGEVVTLKELLDEGRAIVSMRADEIRVVELAEPLRQLSLKVGDHLLFDPRSGHILERLPKTDAQELFLEEVPSIGYEAIGGLGPQIRS